MFYYSRLSYSLNRCELQLTPAIVQVNVMVELLKDEEEEVRDAAMMISLSLSFL